MAAEDPGEGGRLDSNNPVLISIGSSGGMAAGAMSVGEGGRTFGKYFHKVTGVDG